MSIRHTLYVLLERHDWQNKHPTRLDRLAKMADWALIILILSNAIAVILESIDSIYYPHQTYFYYFELFSVFIFATEYLIKLWTIAEKNSPKSWKTRLKWLFSFNAIIDLLAILPLLLQMTGTDLRFLRAFLLLRLFKLTRYFESLRILLVVIEKERGSFWTVIFILMLLIFLSASGIYLMEYNAQPTEFNSIPHAMWWAVVTLTTVGYGDVTPITPLGKLLGAFITVLGVGITTLPAGILATGLTCELENQKQISLYQLYDELMALPLSDLYDNDKINAIADNLHINRKNRQKTLTQVLREKRLLAKEKELNEKEKSLNKKCFCPHCEEKAY
ncbi:MAG: ion transporter [Moraxella sp.]|nr:ion transporter [Moraxella sp.]